VADPAYYSYTVRGFDSSFGELFLFPLYFKRVFFYFCRIGHPYFYIVKVYYIISLFIVFVNFHGSAKRTLRQMKKDRDFSRLFHFYI
jgi:hypothetical protein